MRILIILFYFVNLVSAQQHDHQWYILNKKGRITGSAIGGGYAYSDNDVTSNFSINGASTPGVPHEDGTPKNDLFIIFDNRHYINTRGLSYNQNTFSYSNAMAPQYLYFTNIYEEDDPPQNISVESSIVCEEPYSPCVDLNTYSYTDILSINHNFVRGKDFTVIIPNDIKREDGCSWPLKLVIHQVQPVIVGCMPRNIVYLSHIFQNAASMNWSFNDPTAMTAAINNNFVTEITGINSPGSNAYHFLNFKIDSTYDPCLIGAKLKIELVCDNGNQLGFIEETLRDIHDPNFIRVECIYKQKNHWLFPFCKDRYFVKYFVQFFNDGIDNVDFVTVNLQMPEIVKTETAKFGKWNYGGDQGHNNFTPYTSMEILGNHLKFIFSTAGRSSTLAKQGTDLTITNPSQYGNFEFCVELRGNPSDYNLVSLQPTQPITQFDGIPFPIIKYIDPYLLDTTRNNSTILIRKLRPITTNRDECNCLCNGCAMPIDDHMER
ncbi:MAG: hypothetical protein IPM34_00625 [Saprospiraceae bacterium]|nr:hypothetical protein [Saprospiraceae bacterium]